VILSLSFRLRTNQQISLFASLAPLTGASIVNPTLGIHPVTAGRCAEKGKKLIDNYEGVWDILEERS
jgi:hypothetical protein